MGGLEEREVIERACPFRVCVLFEDGGCGWGAGGLEGVQGVQGVHEASLPYQRHARLSVLMVITLATIGACCSGSQQGKEWRSGRGGMKKMDGGMRRRGIKGKKGVLQLAGAFRLC